jgi:hypothetical protein
MKLIGVTMVRNEADIIEAFVRHNLTVLDGLVVVDHGSADATMGILDALCRERIPLVVLKNEAVGYLQPAIMTQVVRHAFATAHADFVFPLDADEFLKVPSRPVLEQALAGLPPRTHGLLRWPTYVPDLRRPARSIQDAIRGARRPAGETTILTKVVVARSFLQAMDEVLSGGNHWVTGHPDAKDRGMRDHMHVSEAVAVVAHVPIRSAHQFVAKVAIKKLGRVAANIDWKPDAASQASYDGLRAGEPVDIDALTLAALNWSVARGAWRDADAVPMVDDPFLAPIALRYTPAAAADPFPLVLSATERMVRRLIDVRSARAGGARSAPP